MSRTKTQFKSYSSARLFVRKLGLRSIQEWLQWSKSKDELGLHVRPKDIPSNPWIAYKDELIEKGKEFSMRDFLGLPKKEVRRQSKQVTGNVNRAVRIHMSKTKDTDKTMEKPLSFAKAKALIQRFHVKTRADIFALKRMQLLPSNFPKSPKSVYRGQWTSWEDFLSNK